MNFVSYCGYGTSDQQVSITISLLDRFVRLTVLANLHVAALRDSLNTICLPCRFTMIEIPIAELRFYFKSILDPKLLLELQPCDIASR